MKTKYLMALVIAAFLSACQKSEGTAGQKSEGTAEQAAPQQRSIPDLTVDSLLNLSRNERDELERRCLGASHQTCANLKGDSFKKMLELKKAFCRTDASVKGLTDRAAARDAERRCEDL